MGGYGAAISSISEVLDLPTDSPIEVTGVHLIQCGKVVNIRIESKNTEAIAAGSYKTVGTLKAPFRPHHTLVYSCFSGTICLGVLIPSSGKISVKPVTGAFAPGQINMTLQFIAQ